MEQNKKHKMNKARTTATVIMTIVIIIAAALGVQSFIAAKNFEATNNATVEQYMSPINVRVPGYIKEIRFKEHQHVAKGDTLMIIDDREFIINLKQAQANLQDAMTGRRVIDNTANTASTSASVFDESIAEARIRVSKLEADYARFSALLEKNATTPIVVEQYKTELDMARARVNALERQRSSAQSSVSEVNQRKGNADAAILRAEAALEMAELNLSYTVVTAPCDGYLGKRNIEVGQFVNPGQTMTTLIPDNEKWIVANFKETQIQNLHIGQEVDVEIDAFPGRKFKGLVSSISSATGTKYSMIPTDNASGNFVKIRQRIPVRIDLVDISSEDNQLLAAGMMCNIKAKI